MAAKNIKIAAALVAICAGGGGAAQSKEDPVRMLDALIACDQAQDQVQRLSCFDARVAELKAARQNNAKLFQAPKVSAREEFKEVRSTVTAVAPLEVGSWLMVLADHSVWRTNDVVRMEPFKGSSIRITKGSFGSFLANIDDGPGVRVKRLR